MEATRQRIAGLGAGRLRLLLILLASFLFSAAAFAQTYAFRSEAFAYDTPSAGVGTAVWHTKNGAPDCASAANGDDDWFDTTFPSGFRFRFAGVSYDSVRIYANGILAFGNDVSGFHRTYVPTALPAAAPGSLSGCPRAVPERVILAYWTDIVAGTANSTTGASVRYELLGTAPNRRFVISWVNVKLFGKTDRFNFQIVLWESASGTDSEFTYRYTSGSSTGTGATVGVQVSATDFTQYAFNQAFIDTTNGTAIRWYPIAVSPAQVGEYRLDEASGWPVTPASGEQVIDSSGTGRYGRRIGTSVAAPSGLSSAQVCAGATVASNTANTAISAVDLRQTPSEIGNSGSMTFWYRSTEAWSGGAITLFDATTVAATPFHLTKLSGGVLRFSLADSAGTVRTLETASQSFAANTWVHVGVSWFVLAGTNQTVMQIFVNGARLAFARSTTTGTLNASLGTIYFGDNRTSGVTASNGTPNSGYGDFDEIRLYNFDISAGQSLRDRNLTRSNCSPLDHFYILHAGSGSVCQANRVTIRAHDLNHNPVSLVGSVMSISASPAVGSWAASGATGSLTNTGPGAASYIWNNESEIVLTYSTSQAGNVNFAVLSGGISESSGSSDSSHDQQMAVGSCVSSFNACEVSSPVCDPASSGYHRLFTKLAGTAFVLDAVALKSNGSLESGFSGALTLDFLANTATGVGLDANNCPVSSSATISGGAITFASGRGRSASVTIPTAYRDVRARLTCSAAVCGSAITACSSDNFAVRPAAFTVTANLGGSKLQAGRTFSMTADTGIGAQYSGTPVLDASKFRDHAGNAIGTLVGSLPATTTGSSTGSFAYHDVGTLSPQTDAVTDSAYTAVDNGSGDCVVGSASNVASGGKFGCNIGSTAAGPFGRFYPDHFNYVATLSTDCGGFSYMDQPSISLALSLEARSANETVTQRYTSGYGFLGTASITGDNAGSVVDVARLSPALPAATWSGGKVTMSLSNLAFTRAAAPDGAYEAFALKAAVTAEPDGVVISGTTLSSSIKIRHGRLRLSNRYGSEKADLLLPIQAEYWTGKSWAINALDSCTTLPANSFALSGGISANTSASAVTLAAGVGNLRLLKPTPVTTGSVDIAVHLGSTGSDQSCLATHGGTGAQKPWLRSRNGSCAASYDRDPAARGTFGVYSPETRKRVHVREMF